MSVLVLGHKNPDTDSIVSAISYAHVLNQRGIQATAVAQGTPAPETEFVLNKFNLKAPEVVTSVASKELYLVDYSDLAQAPADLNDAKILGIVDHHKLGDVTTDTPLECWIQPYGCSNTIIKMVADYYNVTIPADIAGAMLCAILSDTVLFKSPTCTKFDKKAAEELAKIANVSDLEALGMEMFKAKSNLNASPRDLIFRDFKDFDMGGKKIGIGQLELISLSMVTPELKESLKKELADVKAEGRHSAVLVLTDIMKEGSELLVVSDEEDVIINALGTQKSDNMWMPGVMSRKKQVVPPLQSAFKA
ncbi:manganese-dependent inorganic pyrophosphatase [Succinivibrio dextrinosolvens]|uniref:inorganic diphosphatase n=1 Tax=Succinivibrio dextrinosolvens TaxID=83771 RepID=A0A662ZDY2_9GAMM|nr:manganese-dependent inorganic pyrophosphatase [Succinivibrio dextrinosolvens]SFK41152.1 manganese-dependent inorganic pyrophosphatase [Succinivibrio dextrinosolvens]